MKKYLLSLVCAGLFIGAMPLRAEVSKRRAVMCSLSRLHNKFNCTLEEKASGKKFLKGAKVAAILAALTALAIGGVAIGGVKLSEIQAEKERLLQENYDFYTAIKRGSLGGLSDDQIGDALIWAIEAGRTEYPQAIEKMQTSLEGLQKSCKTHKVLNNRPEKTDALKKVLKDLSGSCLKYEQKEASDRAEKMKQEEQRQRENERWEKTRREEEQQRKHEKSAQKVVGNIPVEDANVKQILGLNPGKDYFAWYEVLGFSAPVSRAEGITTYRVLALNTHPAKHINQPIFQDVMKVINSAKDEINK